MVAASYILVPASLLKLLPGPLKKALEGRIVVQAILSNTTWLLADKFLRMGVGFVVGVWVARYLGPEQFGLYSFALAFVALFGSMANLGLDGIVVRDLVQKRNSKYEVLGSAFALRLCGTLLSVVAVLTLILWIRPGETLTHWLVLILACATSLQIFDTVDLWFQSRVQSKFSVGAKGGAFIAVALVKIVLLLNNAPLIAFAWAILLEALLAAVALTVLYHRTGGRIRKWTVSGALCKSLILESWPLALSGAAIMVYVKVDQIMLGQLVSEKAVGLYAAAARLSEIWYVVPLAIGSSVSPAILSLKSSNEQLYRWKLKQAMSVVVLIAYIVALAVSLFARPLVLVIYGASYEGAAYVLIVHVWAGVFVALGVIRGIWIVAEGLARVALFTTAYGALMNVALNFYLIPKYGALGAAVATVLSYGTSDYLLFLVMSRRFKGIGKVMTEALMLRGLLPSHARKPLT